VPRRESEKQLFVAFLVAAVQGHHTAKLANACGQGGSIHECDSKLVFVVTF
jgi:hypothetical protein